MTTKPPPMPASSRWPVHFKLVATSRRRPPSPGRSRTRIRPGRGTSATSRRVPQRRRPTPDRATRPWVSNRSRQTTRPLARFATPGGEELAKQASGGFGEHPGTDLDAMIVRRVSQDVVDRVDRALLGVGGTVDQPGDARQYHRASAHGAGLEGDVKRDP